MNINGIYYFNEPGLELRGEPKVLEELAEIIRQSDAEGILFDLAFSIEVYLDNNNLSESEG